MIRDLLNFNRGSQLLGHFGFMFAAGFKGPLLISVMVIAWTTWRALTTGLSDHESYLIWMRLYASGMVFMELDAAKDVMIESALGNAFKIPIASVEQLAPVVESWDHMLALLESALLRSALLLAPPVALYCWFAVQFGRRSKERKHERGAQLVTLPALVRAVAANNRTKRAEELTRMMGWRWRLSSRKELAAVFPYQPARIAKVIYPWRLEQSHAMLIGTTGMGKTVALLDMIAEARKRGERAIIFDLTGAYIEQFYDPARDVILNPLDARCPQWSVFDECRDEAEFTAAAEALVPHDGGGAEQFWVLAARLLFVEMCLKLRERGEASNADLARALMTADLASVHRLMRGTIADPLTAPEAARMAESIRAVFNANAKALKLLPTQGRQFSLRQWIEADRRDGAMVFISARYVDMSVCSQLLTVWLDLAMNTLMTLERTRELRLWFFVDELGALHRLPALEKGLQTARNFGGAIVTGIHAFAKLKEVYGDNMAMTLSSLARTKLILGTADRETATWSSDFIGHRQVRDMEEGYTYGYNNARDAVSLTSRMHIEPLQMPDQLMNLPSLSGYLKFPDGFPAAPVKLVPTTRPSRAAPFIRRADDKQADRANQRPAGASDEEVTDQQEDKQSAAASEPPASNDDGAGRKFHPCQGELPLGQQSTAETDLKPPHTDSQPLPDDALQNARRETGVVVQLNLPNANAGLARGGALIIPIRPGIEFSGRSGASPAQSNSKVPSDLTSLKSPDVVVRLHRDSKPADAEAARRLMLEDGQREDTELGPEPRGLGDVDMDI